MPKFQLEITLASGLQTLVIDEKDDLVTVAHNFVKRHGLPPSALPHLLHVLTTLLREAKHKPVGSQVEQSFKSTTAAGNAEAWSPAENLSHRMNDADDVVEHVQPTRDTRPEPGFHKHTTLPVGSSAPSQAASSGGVALPRGRNQAPWRQMPSATSHGRDKPKRPGKAGNPTAAVGTAVDRESEMSAIEGQPEGDTVPPALADNDETSTIQSAGFASNNSSIVSDLERMQPVWKMEAPGPSRPRPSIPIRSLPHRRKAPGATPHITTEAPPRPPTAVTRASQVVHSPPHQPQSSVNGKGYMPKQSSKRANSNGLTKATAPKPVSKQPQPDPQAEPQSTALVRHDHHHRYPARTHPDAPRPIETAWPSAMPSWPASASTATSQRSAQQVSSTAQPHQIDDGVVDFSVSETAYKFPSYPMVVGSWVCVCVLSLALVTAGARPCFHGFTEAAAITGPYSSFHCQE